MGVAVDRAGSRSTAADRASNNSEVAAMSRMLIATSILAFLPGCAGTTEPECDVCTTSAVVYGSITDASGLPVSDIALDIRIFLDECPGSMLRGGSDSNVPRTDASGYYRATILSLWQPFTARCFVISPLDNNVPGWPTPAVERSGALELRADLSSEPRDSIRIDVQLTS